jgi:hypothetical protein
VLGAVQCRLALETKPTAEEQAMRGFDYLTLDPSPRLRKLREDQEKRAKDPAQVIREAWSSVGIAIREALQVILSRNSSPG